MNLPFTIDQFLLVFATYNKAIWPLQPLAYLLGLTALFLVFRPNRYSGIIISGILGLFWVVNGLAYHWLFFSAINKGAYLFGALFIIQGILLIYSGVYKDRIVYGKNTFWSLFLGVAMMLYALLIYPLLGLIFGHVFPRSPVFGTAPCPTTIFTLGLLILARAETHKKLLLIPLVWSVIGFSAALYLGVKEDIGLMVAGVITLLITGAGLIRTNQSTMRIRNRLLSLKAAADTRS